MGRWAVPPKIHCLCPANCPPTLHRCALQSLLSPKITPDRCRAFAAPAGQFARALVAVAGLLGLAALGGAWSGSETRHAARALAASLLGGLLLLPLAAGGAALLAYGGRALFGPGAAIVLAVVWLGVLLALLVYLDPLWDQLLR